MKKLKVFILLVFTVTATWAQSNLVAYEYWFNNDYANKQLVGITPNTTHYLNTDMDVASFPNGVNWFNIRYKDENGKYTAILSKSFVKIDLPTSAQSNLVAYEYWFNNDYANKQLIGITANTTHYLNANMDVASFPNGVNWFNIRYKDENGKYSSIQSKVFVKQPSSLLENKMVGIRYWFDDNITNAVYLPLIPNQQINLIENLDLSEFPIGNHEINFQFKDARGLWSAITNNTIENVLYINAISNSFDKKIVIYPNPTLAFVQIDFGSQMNDVRISITDINGKLVQNSQNNNGQIFNIDFSKYQSGMYFITIMNERSKATYQVIKK